MNELSVIGIAVVAFVLGILAHQIWVKLVVWHTLREMRRAGIDIEDILREAGGEKSHDEPKIVPARLEEYQGQFFLYHSETNEFIAQGATEKEVSAHTDANVPNCAVVVTQADHDVLERFRATAN